MGDRANIRLIQPHDQGSIWIYTHWNGSEMPELLRGALASGRSRWDDTQYLNRILIDQITKPGRDEETGWGISLTMGDNEHNILAVDVQNNTVSVERQGGAQTKEPISFEEYLALPDPAKWRGH